MTHIPALDSVCQLLVELQVGGHLEGVELPGWAKGTSVDEAFQAVRYIRDAEWLEGVYEGYGPQESADRWLEEFLMGKEVPNVEDAERLTASSDDDGDDDEDDGGDVGEFDKRQTRKSIAEFLADIPKAAAARFKKRLEREEGFEGAAGQNLQALSLAMALSFAADEQEFEAAQTELTFLNPEVVGDPDLAAMSKYYLIDKYDFFLDSMGVEGAARTKAVKRIKALGTKLKKAMKATAGAKA
jgi:hypothetical protein